MKYARIWMPVLMAVLLVGCDTVNYILVGTKHAAIQPSSVVLYTTPPAHYEVIAEVTAGSHHGWTNKGRVEHVVGELQQQAAALGANGIIVKQATTNPTGSISVSIPGEGFVLFLIAEGKEISLSGQAIYVTDEGGTAPESH